MYIFKGYYRIFTDIDIHTHGILVNICADDYNNNHLESMVLFKSAYKKSLLRQELYWSTP